MPSIEHALYWRRNTMGWKSFRGDEWWYSGPIGEVEAFCDGTTFRISAISSGLTKLREHVVYSFLLETHNRLKEFNIYLGYSAEMETVLRDLDRTGRLKFELNQSRYGKSFVINEVLQPAPKIEGKTPTNKKWWKPW